jgi:hypothetical protein
MKTETVNQQIEQWPLERLIPYARNPRKNEGAVDRMITSIQEFGFKIPILARSDGQVVDGHLRLKAAQRIGLRELPVILCDEWMPTQVKAFRLLANRSVAWAEWDNELLALEFSELKELKFDLALTGLEPGEVQTSLTKLAWKTAALTEDDALPSTPAQPVTRVDDIWVMGPHRVTCGDDCILNRRGCAGLHVALVLGCRHRVICGSCEGNFRVFSYSQQGTILALLADVGVICGVCEGNLLVLSY